MSNVAVVETRQHLLAGARVRAIIPQSMEEAYRLAVAVTTAKMAPKDFDTPEKALIAIMHGAEIGLPPMASLQRIAVINSRPTIWGDAAIGLVRASGLCEFVNEWFEGGDDKRVAWCESRRKGEAGTIKRSFSVAEARRANLWQTKEIVKRFRKDGSTYEGPNDSPWFRFPDRMLQMRARGICLRDGFADVLGGLYLQEELEGVEEHRVAIPTPPVPPPPPAPPAIATPVPSAAFDFVAFRAALQSATSLDELNATFDKLTPEGMSYGDLDECQLILNEIAEPMWSVE